jgi:gamma-glutamyltranspeptidase/glutathione hydrolase
MLYLAQGQHGKLKVGGPFGDAERWPTRASPRPRAWPRPPQPLPPRPPRRTPSPISPSPTGPRSSRRPLEEPCLRRDQSASRREGPEAILEGPIAEQIVAKLQQNPIPGTMTLKDLASYKPKAAPARLPPYRRLRRLHAARAVGRPAVLEGLGSCERTDIAKQGRRPGLVPVQPGEPADVRRPRPLHGDPDFVDVPTEGLLAKDYLDAARQADRPGTPAPRRSRASRRARASARRTRPASPAAPPTSSSSTRTATRSP